MSAMMDLAFRSIALTRTGGGQGEGGPILTCNVLTSHLTVATIAAPGSVVSRARFFRTFATGAITIQHNYQHTLLHTSLSSHHNHQL